MKSRFILIQTIIMLLACLLTGCAGRSSSEGQEAETLLVDSESEQNQLPSLPLWGRAVSVPGGYLYFDKNKGEIYDCDSTVTEVDIPEEIEGIPVTAIRLGAFQNCTSLVRVSIPDRITRIVSLAFKDCSALADVRLPDSLKTLEDGTFENCSALTGISLPDSLQTIGDAAFKNCSYLSDLTIPAGVRFIKNEAFSGCSSLTEVTLPDGLWELGNDAFFGCTGLKRVTIPGGVMTIYSSAFEGCSGLEELTIQNGVESIWNHAFANCSSLTGVYLPNSVSRVEELAFYGCENLMEFKVDSENRHFTTVSGVLFNKDATELIAYPDGAYAKDWESNNSLIPSALREENYDADALPEFTLDPSVLKSEGICVVPLEQDGALNGELYCVMPEAVRALRGSDADYALVQVRFQIARDDYVYVETQQQAPAYDAVTKVYLCALNGSFTELFSVRDTPPASGTVWVHGEYASAAEIWESISHLFMVDPPN